MTDNGGAFNWYPYQEEIINEVVEAGGVGILAIPTGGGKTAVSVEVLRRMGAKKILVVAPLNTHSGWERHFTMLMPDLPQQIITQNDVPAIDGVTILGWERNRAYDWSKETPNFDAVIVDESARMGSTTAKQTRQTKAVWTTRDVPIKLALSATPAGNRIERIWSTLHWLWPKKFPYFWPFVDAFLKKHQGAWGWEIAGEKRPGVVTKAIPTYTKRTEEEVHGQLPPVVEHYIDVDLTPAQRKIYRQFERDALAWLDQHPVAAALPATKYIRLLQTALAVPTVVTQSDGEPKVTYAEGAKSTKLDALVDLLTDIPESETVVVWTHSRQFIGAIADRVRKTGRRVGVVHGGQSKEERKEYLETFGRSGGPTVLVATVAAMGEGVDSLQHVCATEVWLSQDDSISQNKQAEGRLRRPGQSRTVNRYMIRAKNTLETKQFARLVDNRLSLEGAGVM